MTASVLEFEVAETGGVGRILEPVSFGVPWEKGLLVEPFLLVLEDGEGEGYPCFPQVLARWCDGSVKWLLLDAQLSVAAGERRRFRLFPAPAGGRSALTPMPLAQGRHGEAELIGVDTGCAEFLFGGSGGTFYQQVRISGQPVLKGEGGSIVLTGANGESCHPFVEKASVESRGPLRTLLRFEGRFRNSGVAFPLRFIARVELYAGKGYSRLDFTVWNPQAAAHPGGVWDLGDPGSLFFRDLSLQLPPAATAREVLYSLSPPQKEAACGSRVALYQDSSGGENWMSPNHVNRDGRVPLSFCGYRVALGGEVVGEGSRATPTMAVSGGGSFVAATLREFWQNFPKAMEAGGEGLRVALFPREFSDLFELQGGERKTHTLFTSFGAAGARQDTGLNWVHAPLVPLLPPQWYFASHACPKPLPPALLPRDPHVAGYQEIIDSAIRPGSSFFDRREIIDEYGWRNFGDLYADHEAVLRKREGVPFISHYNNQYDVIKGALLQFMRSGELSWWQMARELASHVCDIDIYHTDQDRYEYNCGLFWHTDHHLDAATCTHRTSSRKHWEFRPRHQVGGGPSHAHNYTTGLLYLYFMTGESRFREGALTLARFAENTLRGPDTVAQVFLEKARRGVKRLALRSQPSYTQVYGLTGGPGRSSGNTLNVLLDAYEISSEPRYLELAQQLIAQCIGPDDDIEARDLLNAEIRWMYTIFLQALGRYLDLKLSQERLDPCFWYGRASLLKYAQWMLRHEYPYLDTPEKLEIPNETWSAQEIRKSEVLAYAARYAPAPLSAQFLERSGFFFRVCIDQLQATPSRELTRVVVLLMTNGMTHLEALWQEGGIAQMSDKEPGYGVEPRLRPGSPRRTAWQLLKQASLSRELRFVRMRLRAGV